MRTASEKSYSIIGLIKNISRIITQFEIDSDELAEHLTKKAKKVFSEKSDVII